METNASKEGIGVVLALESRLIAYFSKGLSNKNKALFMYKRELLSLVSAVQKWRPYLLGESQKGGG